MKTLGKQRKHLMDKVARTGPFVAGTLAITPRLCGSTGCACRRGRKHTAMYLTWKDDGKTRSMYVPVRRQAEAQAMSRNYKKLKKLTRRLSDLHKKMLLRKENA